MIFVNNTAKKLLPILVTILILGVAGLSGCREHRVTVHEDGSATVVAGDFKDLPSAPPKGEIAGEWEGLVTLTSKSHERVDISDNMDFVYLEFFEEGETLYVKGIQTLPTEAVPVEYVENDDLATIGKFTLTVNIPGQSGVDAPSTAAYEFGPFNLRWIEQDDRSKWPEHSGRAPFRMTWGEIWTAGDVTLSKKQASDTDD